MSWRPAERFAAAIDSGSRGLAAAASRRPRRVLIGWALGTLLALPGLVSLERDTDGSALLPRASEAARVDREIRARFDLRDQIVVLVETEALDGALDPALLAVVRELSEAARSLDGVGRHHVTSLATEPRDRLYPGTGETFGSFVEPLPRTPEERRLLAADLDAPAARLLTGTVVSADRRKAAILVGAPTERDRRLALVGALDRLAATHRRPGLEIAVVGAPVATARLADHIVADLLRLVPLSLLVVAVLVWLGTRSPAAVVLVLVKIAACVGWTFGVLGLLGVPVYLTVVVVPVVLSAMCLADEIHLLVRYRRELRSADPPAALARTLEVLATPVVVATATTCIGFLSCLATGIPPIQALGAGAGLGTAYSLGFSLIVTPALLAVAPARWFTGGGERPRAAWSLGGRGLALDHPAATLAVLVVITLVALAGVRRLEIQDSWIDAFSAGSDFRRATERANAALHGVHVLHARLALPVGSTWLDPGALAALEAFDDAARGVPTVGAVIGLVDQLDVVAAFWKVDGWRDDPDEARYVVSRFDFAPGEARRHRVLTESFDETVTTIVLDHANFRDTALLLDRLRAAHLRHLRPLGVALDFGGDVATSQALIPATVRGQVLSLPLALLGVFASVALLCGSLRLAAVALLPVTLSAVWLLGGLGWAGVPLGVATSMFFVLSIGLGVDSHAIHLILRARETLRAREPDPVAAALRQVRPAILVNSAAIAAGFGVLAVSAVPPNRHLGLLVAAAIVVGCGITLGALPALLERVAVRRSARTLVPAEASRWPTRRPRADGRSLR